MTEAVIGATIEARRALGPGLLEAVHEACLTRELAERGPHCERRRTQFPTYKTPHLEKAIMIDLLVEEEGVVEVKSVEALLPVHVARLLSRLRVAGRRAALLVNFNVELPKEGIRRFSL